jgi:hypothetical protein
VQYEHVLVQIPGLSNAFPASDLDPISTRRVRDVTRARGIYLALLTNSVSIFFFLIHPVPGFMEDGNSITTRLLTLLNVSATKIGKRKRTEQDFIPSEKLNKRKSTGAEPNVSSSDEKENDAAKGEGTIPATNGEDVEMEDEAQDADLHGLFQLQFF